MIVVLLAALVVGATVLLLRHALTVVAVRGPSMEPTLEHGALVLVRRRGSVPGAGDIVVLHPVPSEAGFGSGLIIKRVAATAGAPVPQDVAAAAGMVPGAPVPPGRFVVLGDNAAASADSRTWGLAHDELVYGRVIARLSGTRDVELRRRPPDPSAAV
ncbi:S26 family signal peptidase [Cellulomonas sp. URHD0024]|uniref:S26 family signal peptidase n=1 Tax=Cellulomonas sp. URHD0024 TaxID=1302620 RepID=UPI0004230676|nr:S26 family signal peptidase [Cellulomonas sp. URHD0024]